MKKQLTRKLVLRRETLHRLDLTRVHGGDEDTVKQTIKVTIDETIAETTHTSLNTASMLTQCPIVKSTMIHC